MGKNFPLLWNFKVKWEASLEWFGKNATGCGISSTFYTPLKKSYFALCDWQSAGTVLQDWYSWGWNAFFITNGVVELVRLMKMDGLKRRKSNLSLGTESKNYSGSDKITLKSRIHSMNKGWIERERR